MVPGPGGVDKIYLPWLSTRAQKMPQLISENLHRLVMAQLRLSRSGAGVRRPTISKVLLQHLNDVHSRIELSLGRTDRLHPVEAIAIHLQRDTLGTSIPADAAVEVQTLQIDGAG